MFSALCGMKRKKPVPFFLSKNETRQNTKKQPTTNEIDSTISSYTIKNVCLNSCPYVKPSAINELFFSEIVVILHTQYFF